MSKPFPEPDSFQRIELITGTGRRRQWPDDVKEVVVADRPAPGIDISEDEFVRNYDAHWDHVSGWISRVNAEFKETMTNRG